MIKHIQAFIGRFRRTPKKIVWQPNYAILDLAEKAAADLDDVCRFELTEKGEAALAKPKRKSSAKKSTAKKAPAKRKTTRKATAKKKA